MNFYSIRTAIVIVTSTFIFNFSVLASDNRDGVLSTIIPYLLFDDGDGYEAEIVTGPAKVIEIEVDDVAPDYNNSRSTPLARHGQYLYWVYVSTDEQQPDRHTPTRSYVKLRQIHIPNERVEGPYDNVVKSFINNYGEPDHELRVFDASVGSENETHTAPSVGVDREGYIHITGAVHHSRWEYCRSTKPNDISSFYCPHGDSDDPTLPKINRPTYPRFFNSNDGTLYLLARGRFDTGHWFNGTTFGGYNVYDEETKTWSELGGDNYQLGDLLLQGSSETAKLNDETGVFELGINPKWLPGGNDYTDNKMALFYSDSGAYHRYFRDPLNGGQLPNYVRYSNARFGYQAYWSDMKVGLNDRVHVASVVKHSPVYDATDSSFTPDSTRSEKGSNDDDPSYVYDEESYVVNYDYGLSIVYAYSDDGGNTFYAPNGDLLDMPLSPQPLKPKDSGSSLKTASALNGGVAYLDKSATTDNYLYFKIELSLLANGNPVIFIRESVAAEEASYTFKALEWTGNRWSLVEGERFGRSAGGLVSDANGGHWAFESYNANTTGSPTSSGDTVLYSKSGIKGPWTEIQSEWRNGMRIDYRSAQMSNVMRYVDMDIQSGGTAKIISLIPPEYVQ